MLREIKNTREPSPCPKCGAAPKIEKHPPSFGDDGSVVFSCCAITSVADDITGAQAHWDGAVVGYRAGVEDAVALIDAEATKIAVLASGLEPSRQAALESGEEPTTFGEEMWAAGMRLRRLSAALQKEGGA